MTNKIPNPNDKRGTITLTLVLSRQERRDKRLPRADESALAMTWATEGEEIAALHSQ
jgi:hypothetical protein